MTSCGVKHICCALIICILNAALIEANGPAGGGGTGIILRVRKADGSMGKIQITDQESTTLSSVLNTFQGDNSKPRTSIDCSIANKKISDTNQPLSAFGLKNGSLISIIPPKRTKDDVSKEKEEKKKPSIRYTAFDPYPDLARSSHSAASRRNRALSRLPSKRSMSYGDIANLQSFMHVIEPQPTGPITRIYMCSIGAQRFKDSCTIEPTKKQLKATQGKAKARIHNKCALLFGAVNKERVDQSSMKARTSLSTPLYELKMCNVVKVHAVWEPPQSPKKSGEEYDPSSLIEGEEVERAKKLALALGMKPVGWMYSYSDGRQGGNEDDNGSAEDSLPVFGKDIIIGAKGQIENMLRFGQEEGCKYVTLALDSKSGAAEAFQMSDTSVQMVAEGVLALPKKSEAKRFVKTMESISVDSKETKDLDTVFCLVNTAMLSHDGSLSGKANANSIKKTGALTNKTKKILLANLNGDSDDDETLLSELCNFNTLMALDGIMEKDDMASVCKLVTKYSRGQRKGTSCGKELKLVLKSLLSS
mmetsp:Transcript_13383/g.19513  ORF Transcript_13383/g.19513 Transcript_13383/m.19513 type:complete len:533 (-) Transcript_13383:92-1690(-)